MQPTYLNPVYPHECADPFVLKYKGEYWCYRTGGCPDGRIFGVQHSLDLVNWQTVGGAMDPLPAPTEHYWAPEVFYSQGSFYLYYAAGNRLDFHLRVAVAAHPAGPFVDSGRRLTADPFAIDAHVFEDEDGQRFLFYAVDFLDHSRVGTGTVVDRLPDPFTLAGEPHPVSRARYDWQIFDPNRAEKGGVQWHTIEGSFTLKHKGRYYQMFSGGNYQNPSYGVGYAVTSSLAGQEEWQQPIDGVTRLPVLRTLPGQVNGPGHNSVVRGPDNRQLFCAYHIIKPQERFERVLAIDPLEWVGDDLAVFGPSFTPRPAPILPRSLRELSRVFGEVQSNPAGEITLSAAPNRPAGGWVEPGSPDFLLETSLSLSPAARAGLVLEGEGRELCELILDCLAQPAALSLRRGGETLRLPLPAAFIPAAFHLLRLEVEGRFCRVSLDHAVFRWEGVLPAPVTGLGWSALSGQIDLAALQLTRGCEQDFTRPAALEEGGWRVTPGAGAQIEAGRLRLSGGTLSKAVAFPAAEFIANLALRPGARCVLRLLAGDIPAGNLELSAAGLSWTSGADVRPLDAAPLAAGEWVQIRLRKTGSALLISRGALDLAAVPVAPGPLRFAIQADPAGVDLDLLRLTEIV